MSKITRPEVDGYAVDVSLLKLRPSALVLTAACFVALVALLGWLGGGRPLAASKRVANHAANHERRAEPPAIPNNATSRTARPARAEDRPAAATSPEGDPVPGPSPAGFAEHAASGNTPANAPAASEVPPTAVAAAAPAGAATNTTPAPSAGGYAVQAGSYSTVSEANERVSALRAAGFEARAAAVEIAERGTWYRVYSGRFASREEAARHDRKMRAAGAVAATIITPVQD